MSPITHVVLLAAAGAAGTILRAGCTAVAVRLFGPAFPWGTLVVNALGSFAFGGIHAYARSRGLPAGAETVLLVGLLGGLTTYSSFAFQSAEMLQSNRIVPAIAYIVGTNAVCLLAAWSGLRCFR